MIRLLSRLIVTPASGECAGGILVTALIYAIILNSAAPAAAATTTLILSASQLSAVEAERVSLSFDVSSAQVIFEPSTDNSTVIRAVVDSAGTRQPVLRTSDNLTDGTWEVTFSSGTSDGSPEENIQEWHVTIGSYETPTLLTLAGKNITGAADFGGMPLLSFSLLLSGKKTDLDAAFSTPTRLPVQICMVAASAATLRLTGIGNTDFGSFGVIGAGNTLDLDFTGALSAGLHAVTIIDALSEADLLFCSDTGQRLQARSLGGQIAVAGGGWAPLYQLPLQKAFTTENYKTEDVTVDVDITALGTVATCTRE